MKKLIIMLFIFININYIYSQNYIHLGESHSVAKLYLTNYQFLKVNNLRLINDSTLNYSNNDGSIQTLNVDKVKILSVRNGTYALTYGFVGGGLMLLTTWLAVANAESQYPDSKANTTPLILGFTGAGFAIGAIIGACTTRWERLYFNHNKSLSYSLIPEFYNGVCSMKLTLKF